MTSSGERICSKDALYIHFLGLCNTVPHTGWLRRQKCIASQFWRLEIPNQDGSRLGSLRAASGNLLHASPVVPGALPSPTFLVDDVLLVSPHPVHLCMSLSLRMTFFFIRTVPYWIRGPSSSRMISP